MGEWHRTTLGEICEASGGDIQTGPFGSQLHARDYVEVGTPSVMPQNIGDNRVISDGIARVSDEDIARLGRYQLREGDIVYSRRGDVERRALIRPENDGWLCGTGCLRIRISDKALYDPRFVSYALGLESTRKWITRHAVGATMLNLNTGILTAVPIVVPEVQQQRAIADVLGALDDKIAANEKILLLLDALTSAVYTRALQEGCRGVTLGEVARFHNSDRVPLSSRERQERKGKVPYYGAAGRLDYVDDALFDQNLVLVGEDGSVVNQDGTPVVQYIWGPSWVNNHAHVLTGVGIATETLRYALLQSNVAHLVTGAVQPKISMGNLKKLELRVPIDVSAIDEFTTVLAGTTRVLSDQNQSLARTRDELLPLLMSGKVSVRDAEAIAGEAP